MSVYKKSEKAEFFLTVHFAAIQSGNLNILFRHTNVFWKVASQLCVSFCVTLNITGDSPSCKQGKKRERNFINALHLTSLLYGSRRNVYFNIVFILHQSVFLDYWPMVFFFCTISHPSSSLSLLFAFCGYLGLG